MNLRDNALWKAIVVLIPFIFITACKEELNNIGEDKKTDGFDVKFKEFVLPSHVILDSINTTGNNSLVGSYVDPLLGKVTAKSFFAITNSQTTDLSGSDVVIESVVLQLKQNTYYYGDRSVKKLTIKAHELTKQLIDISKNTNYTKVDYKPAEVGKATIEIKPKTYDTLKLKNAKVIDIKFNDTYLKKIKTLVKADKEGAKNLPKSFFGFALVAEGDNGLLGISSSHSSTRLVINYSKTGKPKKKLTFVYKFPDKGSKDVKGVAFNSITSDRKGTPLEGLLDKNPNTPFTPANKMRYVQEGVGIATEVDFKPFIDFFASRKNSKFVFNSIGISIGKVESVKEYPSIVNLHMPNTNDKHKLATLKIGKAKYPAIVADNGKNQVMKFNTKNKTWTYNSLPTAYFQLMVKEKVKRSTSLLTSAINGYTVNRFAIHQDSIKLKVYYTEVSDK